MSARAPVALVLLAAALALAPSALAAPPAAPDLVTSSDSGSSSTDNITSDTTPDFTVANPNGDTIRLCIVSSGSASTPTSHGTSAANPASFTASTLATGSWDVTARNGSSDCATGEVSSSLTITVDTSAPTIAAAPTLVDFIGSNPGVTFTSTPRFDVYAEAGASVTLYEGSTAIGTATSADGKARITVSTPLADGSHTVTAKATDTAGNVSTASPSTTFTVDSTAATATTPDLIDDDGDSSSDNYTTNPRPRFTVQTEAGALVTLYEDGLALGSAAADSSGVATVRPRDVLWFDPGLHCVYAIAMDALANSGTATAELCITVAPGTAPFTTNLGVTLSAESMALSLRSTLAARAQVRVLHKGRVVAKAGRSLAAAKRTRIALRLSPSALKAGRLVVVTTFRSADGRRVVVRRVVRR